MHHDLTAILFAPDWILARGALGRGFLGTIIIGLVIGIIAKVITPGNEPVGCIITMLIGVAGSALALFIGQALNYYQPGEVPGFVASVIGAVVLLVLYHAIFRRGSGPGR